MKGFIGVNCTTPNQKKKMRLPYILGATILIDTNVKRAKYAWNKTKIIKQGEGTNYLHCTTLVKILLRVQIEIKLVLNYIIFNRRVVLCEATTCFSCLELFQVNFSKLRLRFLFMLVYFFVSVCFLWHRNIPVQIKVIN